MLEFVLLVYDRSHQSIGLHHPLDGVTNPKYKLLHFKQLTFCKKKRALAFDWDRFRHLALCLRLILFHCLCRLTMFYFLLFQ